MAWWLRLYYLLGSSYKVFHAPQTIKPGSAWEPTLKEAIDHSRAMLVLFSERSSNRESKWMSEEIEAGRRRQQRDPSFRLIPVQLDSNAVPPAEFLKAYQWLSTPGSDMQDAALQVRGILGTTEKDESERDRMARLKAELDRALEEKALLSQRTAQLQEELKRESQERGAFTERTANLERQVEELLLQVRSRVKELARARLLAAVALGILAVVVVLLVQSYVAR